MRQWLTVERSITSDGRVQLRQLRTRNGVHVDQLPDFVEQLFKHVLGYAMHSNIDIDNVFDERYDLPKADRDSLARPSVDSLLAQQNGLYVTLMGFTGECLAHWTYASFAPPLAITEPKVHSTEPAFDLIAIVKVGKDLRVACIQAKTTTRYASQQVTAAIRKYESLCSREYEFELATELSLLARTPGVREQLAGRNWRLVLMDTNLRDYCIFVVHNGPEPNDHLGRWTEKWEKVIPGAAMRRRLITLPLTDCARLMSVLAERINAAIP